MAKNKRNVNTETEVVDKVVEETTPATEEVTEEATVETVQPEVSEEVEASEAPVEVTLSVDTPVEQPDVVESPAIEQPSIEVDEGYIELADILADQSLSLEQVVDKIRKSAKPEFKLMVARLDNYRNRVALGYVHTDKDGAKANYDLYVFLKGALAGSYASVKDKLSIISLYFNLYKDAEFKDYMLTRFDLGWNNKEQLHEYQYLVVILAMLADPSVREKNKKRIDINAASAIKDQSIIDNISKFYDL